MKRIISIAVMLCLVLSTTFVNAKDNESNKNEKTTYLADEIKDEKELRKRAENGITDFVFEEKNLKTSLVEATEKSTTPRLMKDSDIQEISLRDTKYTVQKIKTVESSDGSEVSEYVAHFYMDVDLVEEKNLLRGTGTGSENDNAGDSVTGATLEMIAYYSYYKDQMNDGFFCFTDVRAKVTRYDSAIQMSNLNINNNKTGLIYSDMYGNNFYGYTDTDMTTNSTPSSGVWYSNTNSTYIKLTGTGGTDGIATASSKIKLVRGTRTWYLECLVVKEYI